MLFFIVDMSSNYIRSSELFVVTENPLWVSNGHPMVKNDQNATLVSRLHRTHTYQRGLCSQPKSDLANDVKGYIFCEVLLKCKFTQ